MHPALLFIVLKYPVLANQRSFDNGQTWLSAGDSRNYDAIDNPQVGFYALRGNVDNPAVTA